MSAAFPRIHPRIRLSSGFTLVELMIALVLSAFLIGGALAIFASNRVVILEGDSLARMQENLRFASDYLVRDVRNAGFRDEGVLFVSEWQTIGNEYVTLDDATYPLIVRYAGRGDCNQSFTLPALVTNKYRVQDGNLTCNDVSLVSGVESFDVVPVCPDGSTTCTCPGECVGVRMALEVASGRDSIPNKTVELKAVFRNRVLESLYVDGS